MNFYCIYVKNSIGYLLMRVNINKIFRAVCPDLPLNKGKNF